MAPDATVNLLLTPVIFEAVVNVVPVPLIFIFATLVIAPIPLNITVVDVLPTLSVEPLPPVIVPAPENVPNIVNDTFGDIAIVPVLEVEFDRFKFCCTFNIPEFVNKPVKVNVSGELLLKSNVP